MGIDNRIEKIRDIANETVEECFGGLMAAAGAFSPLFAVAEAVRGAFNAADIRHRVFAAILALCDELESMRADLPSNAESALKTTWFKRAVQTLIVQTALEVDEERAIRLARATALGCFPNDENKHRQEELASYIRDLAQLTPEDIRLLELMRDVYRDAIRTVPNMNRMDDFTNKFADFKRAVNDLGIHVDDCLALSARLSGFGLAYEVPRNQTVQSPSEHVFRPTRRGLYLLSLLKAAETPKSRHN